MYFVHFYFFFTAQILFILIIICVTTLYYIRCVALILILNKYIYLQLFWFQLIRIIYSTSYLFQERDELRV